MAVPERAEISWFKVLSGVVAVGVPLFLLGYNLATNAANREISLLQRENTELKATLEKASKPTAAPLPNRPSGPHTVTATVKSPGQVEGRLEIILKEVGRASGRPYVKAVFQAKGVPELTTPLLSVGDKVQYAGYEIQLLKANTTEGGLAQFGLVEEH